MSKRSIYRKIAKQNGVPVKEVKAEMQKALDDAWNNPDKTKEAAFMQAQFGANGQAPTTEEFIKSVSTAVKHNQ